MIIHDNILESGRHFRRRVRARDFKRTQSMLLLYAHVCMYILVYTYWPPALENKCLMIIHDNYTSVKVGDTFDEVYVLEILRGHHRTLFGVVCPFMHVY